MQITGMLFHIDVPDNDIIYKPCRQCAACGEEVNDEEPMYEIEQGFWVCEPCFLDDIILNAEPAKLADALNVERKNAGDI